MAAMHALAPIFGAALPHRTMRHRRVPAKPSRAGWEANRRLKITVAAGPERAPLMRLRRLGRGSLAWRRRIAGIDGAAIARRLIASAPGASKVRLASDGARPLFH